MTTKDVFQRVVGALEGAEIPYMLTGSFASSYHGAPRATQDIDFVIAPTADQIRIRTGELDLGYIRQWVQQLQLEDQWEAACRLAGNAA